jgi:hypothetical protein
MTHSLYQKINNLDTDNITIINTLKSKNVKINDQKNHLVVNDNNGNKIFWINEEGCSIKALDKSIELHDVLGFPKLQNGLLISNDNELSFKKDINLDKLNVIDGSIKNLEVRNLNIKDLKLPILSSDSILNKILNSDNINAIDAKIINLKNDKLETKDILTDHINTKTFNVEVFNSKEINTDNLISNTLNINKGKFQELEADDVGIVKLECKNILSHNLDIIETANIKLLNVEESIIADLNVCNADIKILKVDKIIKSFTTFGTLEEPLNLNMINNKFLDCNNEQNNIVIYNKIVDKSPQNKFELINIPEADYNVIVKCHNQFINVQYNICEVDGKKWLFTKFNDLPLNLIVEIILERL